MPGNARGDVEVSLDPNELGEGGLDDDAMRHRYQSELEAQSGRAAREVDDSDVLERRKRKLERAKDSEAGKKFRF